MFLGETVGSGGTGAASLAVGTRVKGFETGVRVTDGSFAVAECVTPELSNRLESVAGGSDVLVGSAVGCNAGAGAAGAWEQEVATMPKTTSTITVHNNLTYELPAGLIDECVLYDRLDLFHIEWGRVLNSLELTIVQLL